MTASALPGETSFPVRDEASERELEIARNVIRNFGKQNPINAGVTAASTVVLVAMLWGYVADALLIGWASLGIGLIGLLTVRDLIRKRQGSRAQPDLTIAQRLARMRYVRRRAVFFAMVSGGLWGSTVFFLPAPPPRRPRRSSLLSRPWRADRPLHLAVSQTPRRHTS